MGNKKYIYFLILAVTIVVENTLNILYSLVNKQTLNAIEYKNPGLFERTVILCILVLVLRSLFPYLRYLSIRLVRHMVFGLKISLFDKLLHLDMNWYESNHSGDGIKAINWDANSLKDSWFSHVYWVLGAVTLGISSIITMFIYSPLLSVISIVVSALTAFLSITLNNSMKGSSKQVLNAVVSLTKSFTDILDGINILKLYSGSSIVIDKFIDNNENVTQKEMERVKKASFLEMQSFLLGLFGSFGTILLGTYLVRNKYLDYGTVMAVATLQISLSNTMQRLGRSIATFNNSLVKASRVFDFLELNCEEHICENDKKCSKIQTNTADYYLDINNLSFAYPNRIPVFNHLSLHSKPNEKIIIKGESGCGKSTLLKLLLRFYDYKRGSIKINDIELVDYPINQLRELITYIPQDCYLFEGTIAENISYGRSSLTSRQDIIKAAKLAYAHDFISEFLDGYDTVVTEGGSNLSGGQRQRIAIARAFLKNSPILLMDEPSSALDSESELALHKAMKELMQDKLVIMVSHRDTADNDFDRVVIV